jgi:membrane protease YdiL (CAAX protease family)
MSRMLARLTLSVPPLPRPPLAGAWAVARAYLRTVAVLLGAAQQRALGRQKRQRALLLQRSGRRSIDWGWIGVALSVLLMLGMNGLCAYVLRTAVTSGQRYAAERQGGVLVERWFIDNVRAAERKAADSATPWRTTEYVLDTAFRPEALRLSEAYGGDPAAIEQELRATVRADQGRHFVDVAKSVPGLKAGERIGPFPAMIGSLGLLWWMLMLVLQGEGLELDTQRRRHPMWEWLFSHPVPTGAVFLAEMLAPIAANPIFFGAPLVPGLLYGAVYGPLLGVLAGIVIGIPLAIAAACLGKGLEICVVLRLPPSSRAAVIGLIGWLGYALLMLFFVAAVSVSRIPPALGALLDPLTDLPWPWFGLFLGQRDDGTFLFPLGLLFCWSTVALAIAGAVALTLWGAQHGLTGKAARTATPARARRRKARNHVADLAREPLYSKELLWFMRDRGAPLQVILVPLTLVGFQMLSLHGVLAQTVTNWNAMCALAILFGTYFLNSVGPRSLASEGSALWITLTWPRGLESLLKAKARMWATISTVMVVIVLGYTIYLFPQNVIQIGVVGVGWFVFASTMAERAVTLAAVTASSGEVQKPPLGRRWAVQLGTLTCAVGVLTQQWPVAIMGLVYSTMTAAAMWQNFRARLPFLFDPWSERLPTPPTLMQGMIAIGILVEGTALVTGAAQIFGQERVALARALLYAGWAGVVSLGVVLFLRSRGVALRDVWLWRTAEPSPRRRLGWSMALLAGVGGGLAVGLLGELYLSALHAIPMAAVLLRQASAGIDTVPNLRESLFVMSVLVAPCAEEFLFRGLLYRALDREWGGWRAMAGSAAFFAVYHPPLSWLPVGLLGLANAWLFKRTGRLAPAVVLHMVYNAVMLG